MKFKVGDVVIGNHDANRYRITKEGWVGTVVSVSRTKDNWQEMGVVGLSYSEHDIAVRGDDNILPNGNRQMTFAVCSSCFDKVLLSVDKDDDAACKEFIDQF